MVLLSKNYRNLQSRHYRKKSGLALVEGLRCCREAVARAGNAVEEIFCTEEFMASGHWADLGMAARRPIVLSGGEFAALTETETPQGVALVMRIPVPREPQELPMPFVLVLDHLADPGNLGTILRTAWAIGMQDVWLVKGSADPWSPKAIRAGMGAQFAVQTHLFEDLPAAVARAKKLGAGRVWCTMPGKGISLFDPAFRLPGSVLVIGNEANGITMPEVGEAVTIPMPGHAESLNAAQAATVFLIEALRG